MRFAAEGDILGGERYGDVLDDFLLDVAADAEGHIYLAGVGANELDFGGTTFALEPDTGFVAALDSTLSPRWQKIIGGPTRTYPKFARVSGTSLVIGGDSPGDGSVYYGSQPAGDVGDGNFFVLHVNLSDGTLKNGAVYEPQSSHGRLHSLAVTPGGDVFLGGVVSPPANFGDGEMTSPFAYQPFLAQVDDAGKTIWSTLFCTQKSGEVPVIAYGSDSMVAILQFGGGGTLELGSTQSTTGGALRVSMPPNE